MQLRYFTIHTIAFLLALICLCTLSGCSGNNSDSSGPLAALPDSSTPEPEGASVDADSFLAWPDDGADYAKINEASVSDVVLDGSSFYQRFGEFTRDADEPAGSFILAPGAEEKYAWANARLGWIVDDGYGFNLSVTAAPAPAVPGGPAAPLEYWVAAANYTKYCWDWFGPFTDSADIELHSANARDRYLDRLHVMTLYVVVNNSDPGNSAAHIHNVTVKSADQRYVTKPHHPQGLTAWKCPEEPPYVDLTWEHLQESQSIYQQFEAQSYTIYRQAGHSEVPVPIGSVSSRYTEYRDPDNNSAGNPSLAFGMSYKYFIQAVNEAGATPLCAPVEVEFTLPRPENVSATKGEPADKVVVSWDEVKGASGYEIYKDQELAAIVGKVTAWEDTGLEDTHLHAYWVKAFSKYVGGSPSIVVYGSTSAVQFPEILEVLPTNVASHCILTFIAKVTGAGEATWSWNFGGGAVPNEVTGMAPMVTTGNAGEYDALLTVNNGLGTVDFPFTLTVLDDVTFDIVAIENDKTTHCTGATEPASNMQAIFNAGPDTIEWQATTGILTPSGHTATYIPEPGAPVQVVTVTCVASLGGVEDSHSNSIYLTDNVIKRSYGEYGKFVDITDQPSMAVSLEPFRPLSFYVDGEHVVILCRWAIWDVFSRWQLEDIHGLCEIYGGDGLQFVGNSKSHTRDEVADFFATSGLTLFDNYLHADTYYWDLMGSQGYIPTTLLIDRDGYIRMQRVGQIKDGILDIWEEAIAQCLGVPVVE